MLDYQISVAGLTFGPGTPYDITAVDGLGTPEVRTADVARPQRDGDFAGLDTYGSRVVTMEMRVRGDDSADAQAHFDALVAAWRLPAGASVSPLTFKLPGRAENVLLGRPRRLAVTDSLTKLKVRRIEVRLEYYSPDAAVYSSTLTTARADVSTATTGRTYPRIYPYSFGGGVSGVASVANDGNYPVWPIVRLFGGPGGSVNATIENVTAGKSVTYAAAIAAGDYVEIDMDARTVLLNGTATRRASLGIKPGWWALDPGTSEIRYTTGGAAGSYAEIDFRSAWLG